MSEFGTYSKSTDVDGIETIRLYPGAPPGPTPEPDPEPPIPMWEEYLWRRAIYMRFHADPTVDIPLWEGAIWYYDGQNSAFEQINLTGNPHWALAAENCERTYRPYATSGAAGWRVFPHGLSQDWIRTDDEDSKYALIRLANKSAFGIHADNPARFTRELEPFSRAREVSYLLSTYIICKELGLTEVINVDEKIEMCKNLLLGHLDQWFTSQTAIYVQPFMLALVCQALIEYRTHIDPTFPMDWFVTIADWVWTNAWRDSNKSFIYWIDLPIDEARLPDGGSPDLNMLIAPIYAYVYRNTGDVAQRDRFDLAFVGGVEGAYLGNIKHVPGNGGKQTSQFTRWSLRGAEWRMNAPLGQPIIPDGPIDIESYEQIGKAYKTHIRVVTSVPCAIGGIEWTCDDGTTGTRPAMSLPTLKHEVWFSDFKYNKIYTIHMTFASPSGNMYSFEREIDTHL